jgi:GNAT superfamily N-acetyltransferase
MMDGTLRVKLAIRKNRDPVKRAPIAPCASSLRYPDSFGATYDEESRQARLPFEVAIEEGAGDRFVVGAFADDRLAAIASFARVEGRKRRHRGEITGVFVDPEHRGRAIGKALMRKLLQLAFALSVDRVELRVVSTNAAALQLYANWVSSSSASRRISSRMRGCAGTSASWRLRASVT